MAKTYVTADIILENGLTLAQERIAMAYVECGEAKEACSAVLGYTPTGSEIKSILETPAMIRRIGTLYNQRVALMQYSCQVDIDLMVRELEQARQIAIANQEASAAIAATMGKCKLHGLLVDKREVSLKRPEDMTIDELRHVLGIEFEQDLRAGNGLAIEQVPMPVDEEGG
jgi:hypothetical protein